MGKAMEWLNLFLSAKTGLQKTLLLLYATAITAYVGLVITSFTFVTGGLISLYNLVSAFFSVLHSSSSGGGSDVLSAFWGFLTQIGFVTAFNTNKPIIFSAISFVFMRFLYVYTLKAGKLLVIFLQPLLGYK